MIGFFPDPYPDELLLSICARYHQRTKNYTKATTSRDLLGSERANLAVDLPGRLDQLVGVFPPGNHYSVERLINENTLFPFYSPFLPHKRVIQLQKDMSNSDKVNAIHGRLGILTSNIRLEYFRFCPMCVKEDRQIYGETYWHRSHLIPGVMACFAHRVWLEQTNLILLQLRTHNSFVAANNILTENKGRNLDMRLPGHQTHLYIAHCVDWILNHHSDGNDLNELRGRYFGLLIDRNLATSAGVVRMKHLQAQFLKFYSLQFLNELDCGIEGRANWLIRMLQSPRSTHHPIQHLLLMNFLRVSVDEFFKLPVTPQPFGAGPWPCLNPVCRYYKQLVIAECQLRPTHQKDGGIFGIFQCKCGYSYRSRKPKLKNSKGGATDIESFGSIWEAKLCELYRKDNYPVREIAEKLGVSAFMIRCKARELGIIKPPGKDGNSSQHKATLGRPKLLSPKELLSRQTNYRKQWKKLVKENPTASRTELRRMQSSIYNWLAKHDSQWLDATSPPRRLSSGPPSRINWKQRDIEYTNAVQLFAEELRLKPGRPEWVSKSRIVRELGIIAVITKRAHLLPHTIEVLERISETMDEFAIRRIQWAADSIQNENMRVSYSALVTRACLSRKMELRPEIQKKLKDVL